jgi:hypothetical protein
MLELIASILLLVAATAPFGDILTIAANRSA